MKAFYSHHSETDKRVNKSDALKFNENNFYEESTNMRSSKRPILTDQHVGEQNCT